MKKNFYYMMFFSFFLILPFLSDLKCSEFKDWDKRDFNHGNVSKFLKEHSGSDSLLGYSKEKDIVVFLGNTGSGKSTLINYLSGKALVSDSCKQIALKDPNDPEAMQIGQGGSETCIPKLLEKDGLLFCDLPGFQDTRGIFTNLLNAIYIKDIIENARTIRIALIVGFGDITDGVRAVVLDDLLKTSKELLPRQDIEDLSCLIITKSNQDNLSSLEVLLQNKVNKSTAPWRGQQKIGQMTTPEKSNQDVSDKDRFPLIKLIESVKAQKINSINIGVIYSDDNKKRLKGILKEEVRKISQKTIKNYIRENNYNEGIGSYEEKINDNLNEEELKRKKEEMKGEKNRLEGKKNKLEEAQKFYQTDFLNFIQKNFAESKLVSFLKGVCGDQYSAVYSNIEKIITSFKNTEIGSINHNRIEIQESLTTIESNLKEIEKLIVKQRRSEPVEPPPSPKKPRVEPKPASQMPDIARLAAHGGYGYGNNIWIGYYLGDRLIGSVMRDNETMSKATLHCDNSGLYINGSLVIKGV